MFSESLSRALGADRRVFLKLDCLQPPGSFKVRGIGRTIIRSVESGAKHLVCSSGGNAGLAAAYCARTLGVPLTVVLPSSTPPAITKRLQQYGADTMVHGAVWDEADHKAQQLVKELDGAYVHPFDQEDTWDGHASLVHEVQDQLNRHGSVSPPDAFVTCVGGGGLLMGILRGLDETGWNDVPVVACETEGASSMSQSLAKGELVTLAGINSVAKSLGAARVSERIFNHCLQLGPSKVRPWVMNDTMAVEAIIRFAEDHRILVEPACGAALAAVYNNSPALDGCETIVVEVCGGAIITPGLLTSWCEQLGIDWSYA